MRKSFVASLLLLGAAATLATGAFAAVDEISPNEIAGKLMNAQMAKELRTSKAARLGSSGPGNDTTWVGYNPAYAGSNYWSIGVGNNFHAPGGTGYWNFDTPVQQDSLQGWWPTANLYTTTGGLTLPDIQRPWWAKDQGNQINYVVNQGPGPNGKKRTYGVLGVWHSDPGNVITSSVPGSNPVAPSWTPLGGTRSAWAGIRSSGDLTVIDPETGNAYNGDAHPFPFIGAGSVSGNDRKFPGYCSQWDQMLYRDVTIPTTGPVQVRFKFSTTMSTGFGTAAASRTGWFSKDPLAAVTGNFIESTGNPTPPIDSFSVYVGIPVEPVAGDDPPNDFVASDGLSYEIFDLQRRWFSEVIDVNSGAPYRQLFGAAGNNAAQTVTVGFLAQDLGGATTARLVFRLKTNRGFDDEAGSISGAYSSGGRGAVQLDDVELDTGSGFALIPGGDFELQSDIDNDTAVSASTKWKSTGKPPAVYTHIRNALDLVYNDICGAVGAPNRICNLAGGVLSNGNFDDSERLAGTLGTAEQESREGAYSPAINLVTSGPSTPNNMGITGDMTDATEDYYIFYELYTGYFNIFSEGNGWQFHVATYPGNQSDGVRAWGQPRAPAFQYFNPDRQCFQNLDALYGNGMIRTSNTSLIPDSLRIGFSRLAQCFRFGISADCGLPLGAYWDNLSLAMIDGAGTAPISVEIWNWINDTFPANENPAIVGNPAAFDTAAAHIKSGFNVAQTTGNASRYNIPGDTTSVAVGITNARLDLVFRILPGPGNYSTLGVRASGLRAVPTSPAVITPGDNTFWSTYIANNGPYGSPGGHPAGTHATRWSELVWNSARCDTADLNIFPVVARNVGLTALGGGTFASMLHEDDPNYGTLGILKNLCFLNDTAGSTNDIACGRPNEVHAYPPAWITTVPASRTGWDGNLQTREGTKILPDGLFTPGTHVQYFFRLLNQNTTQVDLCPDTSTVSPQSTEGSTDGHRWQQFAVLPDAWKSSFYGGLGGACALFVDWNDRRGNERVWVSVADSIGATAVLKRGAHNGWSGPGGVSVNDPAYFTQKNAQAGTTWDLYGVKAAESVNTGSGSLGARLATRPTLPTDLALGKEARNAPTSLMLETYYKVLLILTGDLNSTIFGPFNDKSNDDVGIIEDFIFGATAGANRGVLFQGNGMVEATDGNPFLANFSVSLRNASYQALSGNLDACMDLITQAVINPRGDIYGVENSCLVTQDVLTAEAGGAPASLYQPVGNPVNFPYIASVYHDAVAPNYWKSLVDGWEIEDLQGRYCQNSFGRTAYFYNTLSNVFGSICNVTGPGSIVLDTPNTSNGKVFMAIQNNPVYKGFATVNFGLTKADKVTLKIFDVSGRLVRTLADGQMFRAGEHSIMWDGLDNSGRTVPRGVYFSAWETEGGASVQRKITFLK